MTCARQAGIRESGMESPTRSRAEGMHPHSSVPAAGWAALQPGRRNKTCT